MDFYRQFECQEVFGSIQWTCHYFENYQGLYIKPLACLVNASFSSANLPDKLARIVPFFKKGSRFDNDNKRPISVLFNFSKVFQKAMYHPSPL